MAGDLPPSSSVTGVKLRPAASATRRPTSATARTWRERRAPARYALGFSGAGPWGFLKAFLGQRLGFCGLSGKRALADRFGALNPHFGRHKILKSRLLALSKAGSRWYIALAPNGGSPGLPSQEASGQVRSAPSGAGQVRSGTGFDKACNGLSRGGAAR